MNKINVNWAVIPCAGRGTRFLPITKGVSKEMLNIIDRPTIDYIVSECLSANIKNIVFIINKEKKDLKKYYTKDKVFYEEMIKANKKNYAEIIDSIPKKAKFYFVYQKEMKGLGHAVLQAKDIIKDNNFVVCCGDDITYFDKVSPLTELIESFKKVNGKTIVGGKKVPKKDINKYGCMEIEVKLNPKLFKLKGIVEKPDIDKAPSLYASLGKWIFNMNIFIELEKTKPGKGGEIQLTDAIASLIEKEEVYFSEFSAKRFDCGNKLDFLKAISYFALHDENYKKEYRKYLMELLKEVN